MPYDTLFFADAHLRDRRGDEFFALSQIAQAARKHRVRQVVLAGDGIDRQSNRSRAIHAMSRFIDSLEEAGIGFYFIQGQHDTDDPPWPSVHRHAQHLHCRVVPLGPHVCYGLDFQTHGQLQQFLRDVPAECNLLVAHQAWGEWMGSIAVPQGEFAQLPGHVDHVLTGDLHQFRLERRRNAAGAPVLVCSPGATCAQRMDEPHEHFYVLLDRDGSWRRERLKSRVLIDGGLVASTEDLERLLGTLPGELERAEQCAEEEGYPDDVRRPYLRVSYSYRLPETVRRVEKVAAGRAILYFHELSPSERGASAPVSVVDVPLGGGGEEAATPLGLLPLEVDREKEPEVFDLVARLLRAEEPMDEFARWRDEYLARGK